MFNFLASVALVFGIVFGYIVSYNVTAVAAPTYLPMWWGGLICMIVYVFCLLLAKANGED